MERERAREREKRERKREKERENKKRGIGKSTILKSALERQSMYSTYDFAPS